MIGPSPFILGLVMGVAGCLFCIALGFIGSVLGHYSGERHIARVRSEVDEAHGDVPSIDQSWRGDR